MCVCNEKQQCSKYSRSFANHVQHVCNFEANYEVSHKEAEHLNEINFTPNSLWVYTVCLCL